MMLAEQFAEAIATGNMAEVKEVLEALWGRDERAEWIRRFAELAATGEFTRADLMATLALLKP